MVQPERVLFAHIGRMVRYAGPQLGDEKPQGGGKHNDEHLGHEAFNFRNFDGKLYGFIQKPKLRKIDSAVRSKPTSLDRVTVVFVAPLGGGRKVVGWYKGAVVHSEEQEYPRQVKQFVHHWLVKRGWGQEAPSFYRYSIEAPNEKAVLLPQDERLKGPKIPFGEKGGFGQSNLRYTNRLEPRLEPWMKRALKFVREYRGRNLLNETANVTYLLPSEDSATEMVEGARITVQVSRIERDPAARRKCIDLFGTSCTVCSFDFGRIYGALGAGFIHVHHLKPLAAAKKSRKVDPKADLRPVCPNCHEMLHKQSPPLTIEALKSVISGARTNSTGLDG